ncbi:hypothetical protein PHYSODRAFT_340790 [Phytophthora sojae]|uniref:Uncharacterized protein n=1 Tax=Phytophthora sojae (strain P6497) TaxID=1094619 RepID=G5AAW3_PHYSP|nr:hypothetical protein PHYSODRAFT_340790 [Phytophthora sojae]EGZ07742.1 hypothetical protein PHYSODRAFT_340790 [Phytophthora sojae]|eukprot:XP_009537308.1 hypothetical protein PHYSODRAFT_340790 [Phytophthora sojae]
MESDSSDEILTLGSTASLQLGQDDPPLSPVQGPESQQQAAAPDDAEDSSEEKSFEEVDEPEQRSRFNATSDKALLAEVLATPPFAADRKTVTGVWKGVANRLNATLSEAFSFRECRDRTSLLLRKYAVRKARNEAASGTCELHTESDDILEQLQQLKNAAEQQKNKAKSTSKTQELETAGQLLMQAAEKRVSERLAAGTKDSGHPKCRRLSTLLDQELEEAIERRKLEAEKVELHREELQLRREELKQQNLSKSCYASRSSSKLLRPSPF